MLPMVTRLYSGSVTTKTVSDCSLKSRAVDMLQNAQKKGTLVTYNRPLSRRAPC